MFETNDLVGVWEVPLSDKIYKVEFEHGTTTGKRIVRVNGEEIIKREWMFKLVGTELFEIGSEPNVAKCQININAGNGFTYEYSLLVNGKQLQIFKQLQSKVMKTWIYEGPREGESDGPTEKALKERYRIVLEKESLDVWVNGSKMETHHEFADEGTEISFTLEGSGTALEALIRSTSSGNKKEGIVYNLLVGQRLIAEHKE